jgi:hypothetical protein
MLGKECMAGATGTGLSWNVVDFWSLECLPNLALIYDTYRGHDVN